MIETSGIPVLKGIVMEKVHIYIEKEIVIENKNLILTRDEQSNEEIVKKELERFKVIHEKTIEGLNNLKENSEALDNKEEAEIFKAHLLMVKDPMMTKKIEEHIEKKQIYS